LFSYLPRLLEALQNEAVVVGFLHRLLVKGGRIPDEVAVVGVDDTPLAAAAAVPLSTVRGTRGGPWKPGGEGAHG
jgi:hypothetical protein